LPAAPKKPFVLFTKDGVNNIVCPKIKVCAMVLIFQKWRSHFLNATTRPRSAGLRPAAASPTSTRLDNPTRFSFAGVLRVTDPRSIGTCTAAVSGSALIPHRIHISDGQFAK
jgi:hypothetical protein